VVAGTTEIGEPITFYSPDHPAPFNAGRDLVVRVDIARGGQRLGFIGVCDTSDNGCGLRGLDGSECR